MNQVMLVGRIAKDIEIKEQENKKTTILILAVTRSFKNVDGEYEKDFIPCILWNGIAEKTFEYCKKGDVVAIKGRIESNENEIYIIVEKISFISNGGNKDEQKN